VKVVIFYNPNKETAAAKAEDLAQILQKESVSVLVTPTQNHGFDDWGLLDETTDFAIALGGDGTFLLAAKQVLAYGIPLLGVNFGHLGFLSEYGDITMTDLAHKIIKEDYIVEQRTVLQAEVENHKLYAINDIVVNRSINSNLLYTDLYIDDNLLHSFRSDGIVVCTPTGSTAYSLSAGGAVMDPQIKAFQIVPIAAHSLNSRPHVVLDTQTIVLASKGKDQNKSFYLLADGHDMLSVEPGTQIQINKASMPLKLARLKHKDRNFYSILRDKMKWGSINN
jgi:NAD+ kinase